MKKGSAIIIQGRMSSNRFPGKMISLVGGMPLVKFVYGRCKAGGEKDVMLATSDHPSDDVLCSYCGENSIPFMRGSLDNVLGRYVQAAELLGAEYIVRVGGDTPFVDVFMIDKLLKMLIGEKLDYISPERSTCASGFYSEAITIHTLKKALVLAKKQADLEHVTKFVIDEKGKFRTKFIDTGLNPYFIRNTRLTVDYPEDIDTANIIAKELAGNFSFTSSDILSIAKRKILNLSNKA